MKALILALVVPLLAGCDSGQDAKFQEAQRNFTATVKAQQDELQWKIDDAVASSGIFDESHYLTFRKCHEYPPSQDANKKVCATLNARVAKQEAKNEAQAAKDKAAW
jgi:hypothetical protein